MNNAVWDGCPSVSYKWMGLDWVWISPGGVRYGAPVGAKKKPDVCHVLTHVGWATSRAPPVKIERPREKGLRARKRRRFDSNFSSSSPTNLNPIHYLWCKIVSISLVYKSCVTSCHRPLVLVVSLLYSVISTAFSPVQSIHPGFEHSKPFYGDLKKTKADPLNESGWEWMEVHESGWK